MTEKEFGWIEGWGGLTQVGKTGESIGGEGDWINGGYNGP